jgi:uncharacterized protein
MNKFEPLLTILKQNPRWNGHIHGQSHWHRVVANGHTLADHTPGVDREVVELFGLLHDCKRENDGIDPEHGFRAAQYAKSIRKLLPITDIQFEILHHALANHTDEIHNSDPTIGACYDADRLDLGRVGVTPKPHKLNTEFGKALAAKMPRG